MFVGEPSSSKFFMLLECKSVSYLFLWCSLLLGYMLFQPGSFLCSLFASLSLETQI